MTVCEIYYYYTGYTLLYRFPHYCTGCDIRRIECGNNISLALLVIDLR